MAGPKPKHCGVGDDCEVSGVLTGKFRGRTKAFHCGRAEPAPPRGGQPSKDGLAGKARR